MRQATFAELASEGHLVYSDGYRTKKDELAAEGYRIIRVADVGDDVVRLDSPDFVEEERARFIGTKAAQEGDILLTTKGTVGRVAVMPPTDGKAVYSPQLCFFRVPAESEVVPGYLKAWFKSPQFLQQAAYFMNNTDMAAYLSLRDLARIGIDLPAVREQRAIAEVLGALDDKIAADDRIAALCQSMIDALGKRAVTKFHGGTRPLNEIATVVNGLSYRSTDMVEGAQDHLVTLKSITRDGNYSQRGLKPFAGECKPEQIVVGGDVVVAQTDLTQSADVVGRAVRLPVGGLGGGRAVASLDLAIVRPSGDWPSEAIPAVLRHEAFRRHCLSMTSGTTVLHLKRGAIGSFLVPDLDRPSLDALADAVRPLHAQRDAMQAETRTLAALRDALLPELMSGRLRVKDAESTVEEVL